MSVRHNLPNQLSSFIGRERQTKEVSALMASTRLLTLTGSGGCGKTRLGLAVANRLIDLYPDGVWWVEFPPFTGAMVVPQAIARVLGVREEPGRSLLETIKTNLNSSQTLLVLDNCEHLVDACASLVRELLLACANLRILATSREPLNVEGEVAWRVPSLSVPEANGAFDEVLESEAVRLFSERARAVMAGFTLTEDNINTVVTICQHLDGMPLAIELAAARCRGLSIEQIAARLDDRFRLLTSGFRTAPLRHQTLHATIDWSYDILSIQEQTLLRRLSVFAGGWTLESAEAVCQGNEIESGQILDLMFRLVEKSLVQVEDRAGQKRYRFLETIRQYALEKLLLTNEIETIRRRHCEWFLALAERLQEPGGQSMIAGSLEILETEDENLHTALSWALENRQAADALRFGNALWYCWVERGYFRVGLQFMDRILGSTQLAQPILGEERAKVLIGASVLSGRADEHLKSKVWAEEALYLAKEGDQPLIAAQALRIIGGTNLRLGLISKAISDCNHALELARQTGNRAEIAQCLSVLASAYVLTTQLDQAKKLLEEALALFRLQLDHVSIADTLSSLGEISYRQGNYPVAIEQLQDSLNLARAQDSHHSIQLALRWLAHVARAQGNYPLAVQLANEELNWVRERGDRLCTAYLLFILGWTAASCGDNEQAETLCSQSLQLCREVGSPSRIAIVEPRLGEISLALGNLPEAEAYFRDSLAWSRANGTREISLENIEGYAKLTYQSGHILKSARLLASADSARKMLGIPTAPADIDGQKRLMVSIRSRLSPDDFIKAWDEGQQLTLDQAAQLALNYPEPDRKVKGSRPGHSTNQETKQRYGGLTAREREIAVLVASGMSNRDIASDLVLSENTIASHVGNILSKLGFSTRSQIAVWATEKGLYKFVSN